MVENKLSATDPILNSLTIERVVSYLERIGWTAVDHSNNRIFLFQGPSDDDGEPLQLVLPRHKDLKDARARLAEAVNLLAIVQHESPSFIIRRITLDEASTVPSVHEEIRIADRKRTEEDLLRTQKTDEIISLAGRVSQDFNNLLTTILEYDQMLFAHLDQNDPKREQLREIGRAANRASALNMQLLAMSRMHTVQPPAVNLNDLVSGMNGMLEPLIGDRIQLVEKFDPQLRLVKVDPGQIEQMLVNLVVNARDAMPNGGTLTIETKNATQPSGYVVLEITDSGIGIDKEMKQRIFEPFFPTKEKGRGTGLGLAIAHRIVKESGGNISVESEAGHGTTFQVYLPEAEETDALQTKAGVETLAQADSETVLLVEPEEMVREALEASGYIVLEASGGDEALRLCRQYGEGIDLLIADVVMPEMSGIELLERLRSQSPDMKVLLMSAYADEAHLPQVSDKNLDFIEKPFSSSTLSQKLRTILNQKPTP